MRHSDFRTVDTYASQLSFPLDDAPHTPQFLLVDGTSLYWADEVGLHSMPKAGGAPDVIAELDPAPTPTPNITDIAQSDDFIVWTGTKGNGLTKVHK